MSAQTIPTEAKPDGAALPFVVMSTSALTAFDLGVRVLDTWRRLLDATRDAARAQQDAMFETMRTQLNGGAATDDPASAASLSFSTPFMAPMMAAAKAYEEVGDAMLTAQRNALSTLTEEITH